MRDKRVLILFFFLAFVWGAPSELAAQNTGAPDVVRDVVEEVELGVQVNGGVQFRRQALFPFQKRTFNYQTQSVSGKLFHSVRHYGVGVALRGYGAKLAFAYQLGDGVQSVHWIPFEKGGKAIPYKPTYRKWSLQAQYFVTDWIGVGLSYRSQVDKLNHNTETPINGEVVGGGLLSTKSRRKRVSLYVPAQWEWGQVRLFGRIGSSVFGRANEYYYAGFVRYQSPDQPGRVTNVDPDVKYKLDGDQSANVQFARVGVEGPLWGTRVRGSFGIERLAVPDWTTTWSYGVQVEVGLPF